MRAQKTPVERVHNQNWKRSGKTYEKTKELSSTNRVEGTSRLNVPGGPIQQWQLGEKTPDDFTPAAVSTI